LTTETASQKESFVFSRWTTCTAAPRSREKDYRGPELRDLVPEILDGVESRRGRRPRRRGVRDGGPPSSGGQPGKQEPSERPEVCATTPEPAVIGRGDRSGHLRRRNEA
jgi:hypothetical protein